MTGQNKKSPERESSPLGAGGATGGAADGESTAPPGSLDAQFNNISGKIQQLVKKQNRLQRENEQLRQELEETRKKQAAYEQHILELQHRIAILKMASGEMSEKDKKQFEKTLNQYIREIDKCIAFLSQ